MSKRGFIKRHILILRRFEHKKSVSFAEMQEYLKREFEYLRLLDDTVNAGFSLRTFQRDISELRKLYGIHIEYAPADKAYYIAESSSDNRYFKRMTDSFELYTALSLSHDIEPYIQINKKAQGTEHLQTLLQAIKNKHNIILHYHKFTSENAEKREVQPYLIKEFKSRWYVIVKEKGSEELKSFAFDRIIEIEVLNSRFENRDLQEVRNKYAYCYGITSAGSNEPEEIIISCDRKQALYLKSLPLHDSQEVIREGEHEVRFKLRLHITFDLLAELQSMGNRVKVIQPQALIDTLKEAYKKALELYQAPG